MWQSRLRVWPLRRTYIPAAALHALTQYKYRPAAFTWLEQHLLNPIWCWATDHLTPKWIAPNAITTLALAHATVTFGTFVYYTYVM